MYKFKVRYGRIMTDYTLNKHVPEDQRERQKAVFDGMGMYLPKENSYTMRLPLNWEQVK